MSAKFLQAIYELGLSNFSRWLLPDGIFLNVQDDNDHRIVGNFCENNWREFIKDGAMSLHYDNKSKYMWIRTVGLSYSQMWTLQEVIEQMELKITELKVDYYIFESWDNYDMKEIIIKDATMIKLYLTDQIAYNCNVNYYEEI
jgi:hypothetical protein